MDSKTQSKTKEFEDSYREHLLFLGFPAWTSAQQNLIEVGITSDTL